MRQKWEQIELLASNHKLVLVASDKRLIRAAKLEGFGTFDPETEVEVELDRLLEEP
jgi:hypothetical protein